RVDVSGTSNTLTTQFGTTDVNGVFASSLTTTTAETKTITVTANPGPAQVVLNSHPQVTFVAGPATHFTVRLGAPTVTAGLPMSFTVTALDQFANVATGYVGTANFTTNDAQAVVTPTSHPFTGTDAGIFSGTVTFKTSGLRTLTATDSVT